MIALLFDITSFVLKQTGNFLPGQGNLFLLAEFCLIAFYYKKVFKSKLIFNTVFITLILLFLIHTLFLRPELTGSPYGVLKLNLLGGCLLYLFYITCAILGFYSLIKHPNEDLIEHSSFFWVNVAFIIYASGVFFIFLLAHNIEAEDISLISMLWNYLFCSFNIIKNIFLAKALSINDGTVKS